MLKNISKVIVCILLSALICCTIITVSADTYVDFGDWNMEIPSATNKTEYYLYRYEGADTNVVIPATMGDRTVVKINSNAFTYSQVSACVIPDTVTNIESSAFANCSTLTEIVIPASVSSMGTGAFAGCTSLVKFTMDNNTNLKSIPGTCCSGNTSLEEVYIAQGVEKISNYAFKNCTSLEKVVIPPSVTSIASKAFDGCTSLTFYVYDGSYALDFAIANNIPYVNLGEYVAPTEPTTTVVTEPVTTEEVTTSTVTEPTETSTTVVESSTAVDVTESTVYTEPSEVTTSTTEVPDTSDAEESATTEPSEAASSSAGDSESTTATVTATQAESSELITYIIGDADVDGRITVKDATIIQKHVAKLLTLNDVQLILADANADENVSVKDATQIQKFVAGFKDILYVGNEVKL